MTLALMLLRDRDAFWSRLRDGGLRWRDMPGLALFVALSCAAYGAVLAGWRAPLLSLYVAAKLPMLFLGTVAIVAAFSWMTAAILGAGISFRSTLAVVLASMVVACWILLCLIPVAVLFTWSGVPHSGSRADLRYAHNAILVTHIAILAAAGVAGNLALFRGLRRTVRPTCPAHALFAVWIALFAFVGCQMSWILRPFVGSPFYPVVFMRHDALRRNFYEFVFTEVLPFLASGPN